MSLCSKDKNKFQAYRKGQRMQLKFGDYDEGYGAQLLCPVCGFHYLNHHKVEVFECDEDAKHGVHVTVANSKAAIDTSLVGNPSRRRHGLKIHFICEGCTTKSILSISQHKGLTLFDHDYTDTENGDY